MRRQRVDKAFLGQKYFDAGIPDHERKAVTGVVRVEWNVGSARFKNSKQTRQHFQRAFDENACQDFRTHAKCSEAQSRPVGAFVQLPVGPGLVPEDRSHGIRCPFRLFFEQLVDAPVLRIVRRGIVPSLELRILFHGSRSPGRCLLGIAKGGGESFGENFHLLILEDDAVEAGHFLDLHCA